MAAERGKPYIIFEINKISPPLIANLTLAEAIQLAETEDYHIVEITPQVPGAKNALNLLNNDGERMEMNTVQFSNSGGIITVR